jgi:Peptidase family M23
VALTTLTGPEHVSCEAPVVLSPPLKGHGWWNGNGCCQTVNAHRGATLPINGDLRLPEQFAIDFMRVTASDTCCEGPVRDLKSWPFYGDPVLASAPGTVVEAVDDQPDQMPGPAKGVTLSNAGGNHVIEDIGGGRWIVYAHLKPGSVRVHTGDIVKTGQQLGEVGNSGSSTAPHLYFQVMDRPALLNAVGLPFVFDRQVVEGVVLGSAVQVERDYEAGKALRVDRSKSEIREGEMPVEGQILGFGSD